MWLLYLRFNDKGKTITMHLRCSNQRELNHVLNMAKERGFTSTSFLEEYAYFYSIRTIHERVAPPNHTYTTATFRDKWIEGVVGMA